MFRKYSVLAAFILASVVSPSFAQSGEGNQIESDLPIKIFDRVTLRETVYFGACWQILDQNPTASNIVLSNGYTNPVVERTVEGDFFAGIVEKRTPSGDVEDVILVFAGAQGADAVQGEAILLGLPLDEAARATALYDAILANPSYNDAKIHVSGHSLGAGYAQFILAHSLSSYGASVTDARADFVAFGAPNWGVSSALHHGISPSLLEGRFVDFTASNDPVLVNGLIRIGTTYFLPAFEELGGPEGVVLNLFASHFPTTYAGGLGLPDWLSPAEQQAVISAMDTESGTGPAYSASYGPPGMIDLHVDGSNAADAISGLNGNDKIKGGRRSDRLSGAQGADTFVYKKVSDFGPELETITDFSAAEGDRIDLSAIDAKPLTIWDEAFMFIGQNNFNGPGQVRSLCVAGNTMVYGNTDFDINPEFSLKLEGCHNLTMSDFVL